MILSDSLGKGIMADDATAPFVGASLPRPSSEPIPSFRDVSGDAIHAYFFPFFAGLYYATYPQDGIIGNCELLLRSGMLLDSRLKDYEERVAGSKAKGKERKKKIKSLTKSLDNLHAEVAHLSTTLNQATMLKAEKDEEILHLKSTPSDVVQGEILSLAASDGFKHGLSLLKPPPLLLELIMPFSTRFLRDARVSSPITKELTVTPASKYLELSTNADLTPYVVAFEHNEEMVNAEVDGSDPKMTDDIGWFIVGGIEGGKGMLGYAKGNYLWGGEVGKWAVGVEGSGLGRVVLGVVRCVGGSRGERSKVVVAGGGEGVVDGDDFCGAGKVGVRVNAVSGWVGRSGGVRFVDGGGWGGWFGDGVEVRRKVSGVYSGAVPGRENWWGDV
ncbi:hypothetical protein Tco_1203789 [Tanacetum coccineum]